MSIPCHLFMAGLNNVLSSVLAELYNGSCLVPLAGDWILDPDRCCWGEQRKLSFWAVSDGVWLTFLFVVKQSLFCREAELGQQMLPVAW